MSASGAAWPGSTTPRTSSTRPSARRTAPPPPQARRCQRRSSGTSLTTLRCGPTPSPFAPCQTASLSEATYSPRYWKPARSFRRPASRPPYSCLESGECAEQATADWCFCGLQREVRPRMAAARSGRRPASSTAFGASADDIGAAVTALPVATSHRFTARLSRDASSQLRDPPLRQLPRAWSPAAPRQLWPVLQAVGPLLLVSRFPPDAKGLALEDGVDGCCDRGVTRFGDGFGAELGVGLAAADPSSGRIGRPGAGRDGVPRVLAGRWPAAIGGGAPVGGGDRGPAGRWQRKWRAALLRQSRGPGRCRARRWWSSAARGTRRWCSC